MWQTTGTEANADANENHGEQTVVNNVVFAGSYTGYMRAFDAKSGEERWSFYTGDLCNDENDDCGRAVNTAPTIINCDVYWGYGYGASRVAAAIGNPFLSNADETHLLKFALATGDDGQDENAQAVQPAAVLEHLSLFMPAVLP